MKISFFFLYVLFYLILSYLILSYFILFYFILFYFILFYFILFYFILFYFILFYFILFYFILMSYFGYFIYSEFARNLLGLGSTWILPILAELVGIARNLTKKPLGSYKIRPNSARIRSECVA